MAYSTSPVNENCIQWKLDDNAASATVVGSELNGALVGANSADVQATCNGFPAFRLSSGKYVSVTIPKMWPSSYQNLWTKYASNPVITPTVQFGQLVAKPGGGWYFYGSSTNTFEVYRWDSTDLVTWSNKTKVLASGGATAWDNQIQVVSVFQRASDSLWMMFYRGFYNNVYQIGLATSADGATWTRKDNGGTNDGLFAQLATRYDPVGVMLVGTTYYVYLNGTASNGTGHGQTSIYTSTDDCATFTKSVDNLFPGISIRSNHGAYCSHAFKRGSIYYLIVCIDNAAAGSGNLYEHGMALYSSTDPLFPESTRQFLGYIAINDQTYDAGVLDTPAIPCTDAYRTTYASEFSDTLKLIYTGATTGLAYTQNLVSTSLSGLSSLKPRLLELQDGRVSFSFWMQFDSIADGTPIFSLGPTATASSPSWFALAKTSGANKVFGLFVNNAYKLTTTPLVVNTPYHVAIVNDGTNRLVYINGTQCGSFTEQIFRRNNSDYLFIGSGYNSQFPGYLWDFRIYPHDLSATQVANLYASGYEDGEPPSGLTAAELQEISMVL